VQSLLYLVLGAPDSGRRAIVQDLIDGGLAEEESSLTLTNEESHQGSGLTKWRWENNTFRILEETNELQATHQFLIFAPYLDLADQIEASLDLLDADDELTLARTLFVVHCGLLEETSPQLQEWHDTCAHFADIALLNRQEGVNRKLIEEFKDRYESMRLPFLVENVRKDRIANPAIILDLTPRRISQVFDLEEDLDSDLTDPHLERLPTGERAKTIPLPFGEPLSSS